MTEEQKTRIINALKGLDAAVVELLPGAKHITCDICLLNDALTEGTAVRQMLEELNETQDLGVKAEQEVAIDTAMCLWEDVVGATFIQELAEMRQWHAEVGVAEMRSEVAAMVPMVDRIYTIAQKRLDYDAPFDLEFVPEILSYAGLYDHPQTFQYLVPDTWCMGLASMLDQDYELVRMLWTEEYGE